MTLGEIAHEIARHDVRALVVQFFEGRWRCHARTPTGIPITVDGAIPADGDRGRRASPPESRVLVVARCDCGMQARTDSDGAAIELKNYGHYAYGAHVSDPRAVVMRCLWHFGWRYEGGRIGKQVIAMRCSECAAPSVHVVEDAWVDPG